MFWFVFVCTTRTVLGAALSIKQTALGLVWSGSMRLLDCLLHVYLFYRGDIFPQKIEANWFLLQAALLSLGEEPYMFIVPGSVKYFSSKRHFMCWLSINAASPIYLQFNFWWTEGLVSIMQVILVWCLSFCDFFFYTWFTPVFSVLLTEPCRNLWFHLQYWHEEKCSPVGGVMLSCAWE